MRAADVAGVESTPHGCDPLAIPLVSTASSTPTLKVLQPFSAIEVDQFERGVCDPQVPQTSWISQRRFLVAPPQKRLYELASAIRERGVFLLIHLLL